MGHDAHVQPKLVDMESVKSEVAQLIVECQVKLEAMFAQQTQARLLWKNWLEQPAIRVALDLCILDQVTTSHIWPDGTCYEQVRLATGDGWFIAVQSLKGIAFERGLQQYGAEAITEEEWWKALLGHLKPKED